VGLAGGRRKKKKRRKKERILRRLNVLLGVQQSVSRRRGERKSRGVILGRDCRVRKRKGGGRAADFPSTSHITKAPPESVKKEEKKVPRVPGEGQGEHWPSVSLYRQGERGGKDRYPGEFVLRTLALQCHAGGEGKKCPRPFSSEIRVVLVAGRKGKGRRKRK